MKAKEVMELLDISRRTLTRYITKGFIISFASFLYTFSTISKYSSKFPLK